MLCVTCNDIDIDGEVVLVIIYIHSICLWLSMIYDSVTYQLLGGGEHHWQLLERLLQRRWKQVLFHHLWHFHPKEHICSFSVWIHTVLNSAPGIAFLGRSSSTAPFSLGKLHGNAFNSIFRQKVTVFGTSCDTDAGIKEFSALFSKVSTWAGPYHQLSFGRE